MPEYDRDGLDRLAVAILQNAVEYATLSSADRATHHRAWEAARWLETEAPLWFDVLEIGVPPKAFERWIKTTQAQLLQTDNLTHYLANLTEQIETLPQEIDQ